MAGSQEANLKAALSALRTEVQVWTEIVAALRREGFRGKEAGAAAIVATAATEVLRVEQLLAALRKHLSEQT